MRKTLVTFLLVASAAADADQLVESELLSIYGSEESISIATGFRQPMSKAPAVTSVIDAREIRAMGAFDLDDVLETVPGLHVSRNHQGYLPIYVFRGIYADFNPQVLLSIDGVPQTNLFTGGKNFVWGGMPVDAIERIEIIRGPGSAIYGADAFAGVINVITRSRAGTQGVSEAGVRYGTFNTRGVHGSFHKRRDDLSFFLGVQWSATNGQDEIIQRDLQSYLDSIGGTSVSLAPGSVSLPRESLDINFDLSTDTLSLKGNYQGRRDIGSGAGISQALDPSGRFESDRYQLQVNYSVPSLIEDVDINVDGSFLGVSQEVARDARLFPPGSSGPFLQPDGTPTFGYFADGVIGNPEVFERHLRLNTTFHYTGIDSHDLAMGVGYYHGDLYRVREEKNYCTDEASCDYILPRLQHNRLVDVSDTPFVFLREGRRENRYLYLQDVMNLSPAWQLTAGLRYDYYSDFGETLNPRLALVWSTTNDLTTKFLYGEAFRAPAFAETRAIGNPSALGNPDLKPETMTMYELVFDYKVDYNLDVVFNGFYYEWDDIILFVPEADGGTARARNAGQQRGHGAEVEIKWLPAPELEITANYAWQKSTNTRSNADSANAPEQQFYVRGDWQFMRDSFLNLQVNHVMDRNRQFDDARSDIDDYVVVHLTLRRTNLWRNLSASIAINNLFNEDLREPSANGFPEPGLPDDLPLPGRTVLAELRLTF